MLMEQMGVYIYLLYSLLLQAQEFRCQASCYENERIPDDQLENCGNNCSLPVSRFINFVNREYSGVVVSGYNEFF